MEMTFGDPTAFAVRWQEYEGRADHWIFAYCHLILAGELIGHQDEQCTLNTWLPQFIRMYRQVGKQLSSGDVAEFAGLTDREVFELILKSNQLTDEFKQEFSHLPAPESDALFRNHFITLGETTDAYALAVVAQGAALRFMWENQRQNTGFKCVIVPASETLDAMSSLIKHCLNTYPELRHGSSEWQPEIQLFL